MKQSLTSKENKLFNFEVNLLGHCCEHIPELAALWFNELGKISVPNASIKRAIETYQKHTQIDTLPMTYVGISNGTPIAMVSLRHHDGIREDLTPWLGSLIVHPDYRRQGIGEKLIHIVKLQVKIMQYKRLYLFAIDPSLTTWYSKLGFKMIAIDQFHHHSAYVMEIAL